MDQFDAMAYKGEWRSGLEFIARAYKENSAVRSAIEGERNLQGFFTAYLSICIWLPLRWNLTTVSATSS